MEVMSTSNLVSLETGKTTTAKNLVMNSFAMLHDLMRGQIGSHGNKRLFIRSFMVAGLWKKAVINTIVKQPFRGVLKKRYSENMLQIYRRTPAVKCDFKKVALQIFYIFSEHLFLRTPLDGCFWHLNKAAKLKPRSTKLKEKICFTLKMHYFSQ